MYYKHLYYVFIFLCKIDYISDKFNHAPMFTYNKVVQVLELASVEGVIDAPKDVPNRMFIMSISDMYCYENL